MPPATAPQPASGTRIAQGMASFQIPWRSKRWLAHAHPRGGGFSVALAALPAHLSSGRAFCGTSRRAMIVFAAPNPVLRTEAPGNGLQKRRGAEEKISQAVPVMTWQWPMGGGGGLAQGLGGGGEGLRSGGVESNCGKIAVPSPNLPKPQRATPLHRGHTGHQHAREGDGQKAIAENCRKLRGIASNCEKLRTSPAPPAPLQWLIHTHTQGEQPACRGRLSLPPLVQPHHVYMRGCKTRGIPILNARGHRTSRPHSGKQVLIQCEVTPVGQPIESAGRPATAVSPPPTGGWLVTSTAGG